MERPHEDANSQTQSSIASSDSANAPPPALNHPNDSRQTWLCEICKAIDFKSVFAIPSSSLTPHGLQVAPWTESFHPACGFCSLVSIHLRALEDSDNEKVIYPTAGYHLRAFDSLRILKVERTASRIQPGPNIVLAVIRGPAELRSGIKWIEEDHFMRWSASIAKGTITQMSSDLSMKDLLEPHARFKYHSRQVHPTRIDWPMLKYWIQECTSATRKRHRRCRLEVASKNWGIHVIDCIARRVVQLPEGRAFIALGYVWGPKDREKGRSLAVQGLRHSLPSSVTATIEDAMEAVRQLGERYLWVDPPPPGAIMCDDSCAFTADDSDY